jgi:hemerythrin-like domain-containing protein
MAMSPTEMLENEHRVIQKVVAVVATLADKLAEGIEIQVGSLRDIIEFMRIYADQYHHGKEEDLLFPALAKKGVPMRGCPVEGLMKEHLRGRALVKGLAEAADSYGKGDSAARKRLIDSLRGILELYPNHIWKEDFLLFPMANKVLSSEDQESLSKDFEKVDQSLEQGAHQRFEHLPEVLAQSLH